MVNFVLIGYKELCIIVIVFLYLSYMRGLLKCFENFLIVFCGEKRGDRVDYREVIVKLLIYERVVF